MSNSYLTVRLIRHIRSIGFAKITAAICVAFCLVFWAALASGCSNRAQERDETPTRVIEDGLGIQQRVPFRIQRIVTLAPGVTEIVVEAGGLALLVGVSNADNYPPSVLKLPNYSALPVNYEAITALKPDLVLATTQVNDHRSASVFENLGIPAFYLSNRSLEETLTSIEIVGELIGTREIADSAVAALRLRIDALRSLAGQLGTRPRVLFLLSAESLNSFGSESYMHDLIELAGGTSISADLDVENPILNDEFVLVMKPEVIVGTFGDGFEQADLVRNHPTWTLLPAVESGRIFDIDADLVLRAGPRIVTGAEVLFALIHPEIEL